MLKKGDTIFITKVKDNEHYNKKIKNKMLGSIVIVESDACGKYFCGIIPECDYIIQYFNIKDIDFIVIKNNKINLVRDLYRKAKIGGFACDCK